MIIPPNSSKPTLMKQSGRVDAMSEGLTSGAQKKSRRCDADTSGWRWTERVCGGGGLTLTWIQPGSTPEAGDAVWRRRRRRLLFLLGDGVHFAWIVFQAHGRQRRLGRRCRRHRRRYSAPIFRDDATAADDDADADVAAASPSIGASSSSKRATSASASTSASWSGSPSLSEPSFTATVASCSSSESSLSSASPPLPVQSHKAS